MARINFFILSYGWTGIVQVGQALGASPSRHAPHRRLPDDRADLSDGWNEGNAPQAISHCRRILKFDVIYRLYHIVAVY